MHIHVLTKQSTNKQVMRMLISIKPCELSFSFDEDIKIKSLVSNGEHEFTITFEQHNEKTMFASNKFEQENPREMAHVDLETKTFQSPIKQPDSLKYEIQSDLYCPTAEDVGEYIRTLDNYTYDSAIIQEHFLGRVLNSRDDANLYHKLGEMIREATDEIKNNEKGEWKFIGLRKLSKTKRVKTFTFVKHNSDQF